MIKSTLYIVLSVVLLCSLLVFCLPGISCQPGQDGAPPTEKVLNLYGVDPWTLDPAVSGETTSHSYIMQLFSGLVCLDDNLEPVSDIAQRWGVSDDGRTYTFYLRDDVSFHNGEVVKAEDFEYSWQRACDPGTGSLTAATYLGDIVGVKEVLAGVTMEISGVKVIDDYTLQVTIDAPKSYFLSKLTYPTTFVVDRANVESGGEWWQEPNGTGPFKLKQWDENSLLVLERNELYYGDLAKVNNIVFYLWGGVPMNMYETGKIDVTGVSLHYIDKVIDESGPFYKELVIVPELSFFYIGFNCSKPPFDDVNIRRAFSQAIDKDKLASLVFRGMVQQADGILPPGMPGFNEDLSGLDYDINEAKELISASKYGDVSELPPITITTVGWGGLISSELEAIIHQWRQNLGVEVTVRQLEPQRFLYHLKQEKDEMFSIGWIADYPHPQDFLEVLFHSDADNNYGDYSDPEMDALLEMAGMEPDSNLSLALYQQAEQRLVNDAACLPLWFGENYILIKPHIKGYNLNPLGLAMLNSVSVEPH
ncbi:MAG TPA: peptide ABC transporter substrate-binding protein [Dehalococcoidia bacterium]|jgi:oligopeptide transport system substrate-binding protein|nr:peptide ABC transporter substrate-binding protein [Dehalococcoidia bacterium]